MNPQRKHLWGLVFWVLSTVAFGIAAVVRPGAVMPWVMWWACIVSFANVVVTASVYRTEREQYRTHQATSSTDEEPKP